jgi:hypothetical protein
VRGFETVAWRDPRSVRKTLNGTGMVTATKTVTVTYQSGRSEVLRAGVTRLAPDHPLVKQRPGLFLPCDQDDKATVDRMRQYTGSCESALEQATSTQREPARVRTAGII